VLAPVNNTGALTGSCYADPSVLRINPGL
jgi:hypothetical protein